MHVQEHRVEQASKVCVTGFEPVLFLILKILILKVMKLNVIVLWKYSGSFTKMVLSQDSRCSLLSTKIPNQKPSRNNLMNSINTILPWQHSGISGARASPDLWVTVVRIRSSMLPKSFACEQESGLVPTLLSGKAFWFKTYRLLWCYLIDFVLFFPTFPLCLYSFLLLVVIWWLWWRQETISTVPLSSTCTKG